MSQRQVAGVFRRGIRPCAETLPCPSTGRRRAGADSPQTAPPRRLSEAPPRAVLARLVESGGVTCARTLGRNERVDFGHLHLSLIMGLHRTVGVTDVGGRAGTNSMHCRDRHAVAALHPSRDVRGFNRKIILASPVVLAGMSGCIGSGSPPAPQKSGTTVIVPPNTGTTVICSDGTHPPRS